MEKSRSRRALDWISDRFALRRIWNHVLDRRVAKGSWYFGDGATLLLLFVVLMVTGATLMLSYRPTLDQAYSSVVSITTRSTLSAFVRGLHYWCAGLMVVMLFFHLFRQILLGGYKSPREGSWLIGVFLFFGIITMSLLGYILRWDERGIYAFRVAMNLFHRVPFIGDSLVLFAQGGREITDHTVSRVYAAHVIFGPLFLMSLIGYHLYLVVVHSITSPTEREVPVASGTEQKRIYKRDALSDERGETFFPDTAAKSGLMGALFLLLALGLTLVVGARALYPQANLDRPSMPMEEWWWSWFSALAALVPPWAATYVYVGLPLLTFTFMLALPFLEKTPFRGASNRPAAIVFVGGAVLSLIGLSSLRIQSHWTGWPDQVPPAIPAGLLLTEQAEQGRHLFARYGCNSCHAIDGRGPRVGPDLSKTHRVMSQAALREYVLRPPAGVAMSPYEGRLKQEELNAIVAFVLVVQTTRDQ